MAKNRSQWPSAGAQCIDTDEDDVDVDDDDDRDADDISDEDDDMEATGFEALEAEERRSAAIARREDRWAEREEDEHRKAKAARRSMASGRT